MKTLKYLVFVLVAYLSYQNAYAQSSQKSIDAKAGQLFSFGLIADPQYADAETAGSRHYRNSLKKLDDCVSEFNSHDLSFTITLGDLIDRDFSGFDKILPILERLKAPVYNVIGNHDFSVEDKFKGDIRQRLKNRKGYFNFSIGDFVFIVLDGTDLSTFGTAKGSKQYKLALAKHEELKAEGANNAATWNGGIGKRQLKWLERRLREATQAGKKAILFCHWPLLPENGTQLWNNQEVLSLINSHECSVAWISGHHHAGGYHKSKGIHHLTVKGMVETENTASYGIMEVYPDKLFLKGFGDQEDLMLKLTNN